MDFFYGDQSEFFSFYRIPKALITEKQFKNLSDLEKHQLLYKVRQGLGKSDRLYPLQFLKIQTSENQISGDLIFGSLEVRNSDANKTDRN